VEKLGEHVEPYFKDFGDEIVGLSKALGAPMGDLVALNLVYQIEHVGLNCSNWNNTGPVADDDAVEPSWKHGCVHNETADAEKGPGFCTSVIAEDLEGRIFHGRNLDWNLDKPLLDLIVDVDYQRNNKTVFTGTTLVGFVGILHGMRAGQWSWSMDARQKGGEVGINILEALLTGARTPAQEARFVMQGLGQVEANTFDLAVKQLSSGPLVNDAFFIVAGTKSGEGAVVARDRNKVASLWTLEESAKEGNGFFMLETNYDYDKPVPKADDRRTPGIANMKALTQANVSPDGMLSVMSKWPTFNYHTDFTAIIASFNSTYDSYVWL